MHEEELELIEACENDDLEKVKSLIGIGINVNAQNDNNFTALMGASSSGNLRIVKYLICKGADIDAQDKDGMTALMWAANCKKSEVVKYLIEKGANINIKDNNGSSILNNVLSDVMDYRSIEMLKYLIKNGVNFDFVNYDSYTALKKWHIEVKKCLKDNKIISVVYIKNIDSGKEQDFEYSDEDFQNEV